MTLPLVLVWFASRDSDSVEPSQPARRLRSDRQEAVPSSATALLAADESRLLNQLRSSDPTAIETIVRLYGTLLHRVAVATLGRTDGADDVVQEVLFRVWQGRQSLHLPVGMRGYLIRATRNQALNVVTSRAAAQRRETAWEAHASSSKSIVQNDAERAISSNELSAQLRRIFSTIPPRAREIFLLSWEEDLSYAEIAELLNISVATVRNQMSRAGRRLAEYLAEHRDL